MLQYISYSIILVILYLTWRPFLRFWRSSTGWNTLSQRLDIEKVALVLISILNKGCKENRKIKRPALGRNVFIGELYDSRTETLSSRSLFKRFSPPEWITETNISNTVVDFKFIENISNRFELLGVNATLQFAILYGLVKVSGSGEFLTKDRKFQNGISCSILQTDFTVSRKFCKKYEENVKYLDLVALSDPAYTHVVVETNWGANWVYSLEARHSTDFKKNELKRLLKSEMSNLAKFIKTNNGDELGKLDFDRNPISVTADVLSECVFLTSVKAFCDFVVDIPNLLKTVNEGKGKVLNFTAIPLTAIRKVLHLECSTDGIYKKIDENFFTFAVQLSEEIATLKRRLNVLIEVLKKYEKFLKSDTIQEFENKKKKLEKEESELKLTVMEDWKDVKCGKKSFGCLMEKMEKFRINSLIIPNYEPSFSLYASFLRRITTISDYISSGIDFMGKDDSFADYTKRYSSSEFIVTVVSLDLNEESLNTHEKTFTFFDKMIQEKKTDCRYIIINSDLLTSDSNLVNVKTAKCFHLKDTKVLSSDLVSDYTMKVEYNVARLVQNLEIEHFTQIRGKRVPLEMTCPGFQSGSCCPDKIKWICFRCRSALMFGFDGYFYCLCGRGNSNDYTFRCNHQKHGIFFIHPSDEFLKNELLYLKPLKELNILILGQSGVGKSTWINSIVNYFEYETLDEARREGVLCEIPISHTVYDTVTFEKHKISVGENNNTEITEVGCSATQVCHTYGFIWNDRYVRLIDTPGLGDCRGVEQDKKNIKNINGYVGLLKELHVICILIKSNENRLNSLFSYSLKEILLYLHKSVAPNVTFCFTNARSTMYRPGRGFALLESLLEESGVEEIIVRRHNVFFLDNEPFLYLCTLKDTKLSYSEEIVRAFEKSWEISRKETRRFFTTVKTLQPHLLEKTFALVTARNRILTLSKSIAEINSIIDVNLDTVGRIKEEVKKTEEYLRELVTKLEHTEIQFEKEPLKCPQLVCVNNSCVEYVPFVNSDKIELEYKTICQSECNLPGVICQTVNHHMIEKSTVMKNGKCTVCGCTWQNHMCVMFSQKKIEKKVINKKIEDLVKTEEAMKQKSEKVLEEVERITKKYKQERNIMVETSIEFGMYLKENSMIVYNDSFRDYLNYILEEIKHKKDKTKGDERLLAESIQILAQYEAEVNILKEVIRKGEENRENPSPQKIQHLEDQLDDLELCKEVIKRNILNEGNDSSEFSETSLVINEKFSLKNCG